MLVFIANMEVVEIVKSTDSPFIDRFDISGHNQVSLMSSDKGKKRTLTGMSYLMLEAYLSLDINGWTKMCEGLEC